MATNWNKILSEKKIEKCSLAIQFGLLRDMLFEGYSDKAYPRRMLAACYILNLMKMEKCDYVRIDRHNLANFLGVKERQVTKITNALHQKGIIIKRLVGSNEELKTYNYYKLNWDFIGNFCNENGLLEYSNYKVGTRSEQKLNENDVLRTENEQKTVSEDRLKGIKGIKNIKGIKGIKGIQHTQNIQGNQLKHLKSVLEEKIIQIESEYECYHDVSIRLAELENQLKEHYDKTLHEFIHQRIELEKSQREKDLLPF